MENWSRRAGLTVGGLPGQPVQGEEEQDGGEGLGNCLESLEDATYQVWKWKNRKVCTNIFMLSFRTY